MEPILRKNNPAIRVETGIPGLSTWLLPLARFTIEELLERAALTEAERARLDAFADGGRHDSQRRREWLGARVLAREELEGEITYTPQGRPQLAPPSATDISISHTTGWVALAASSEGVRCGIDIELQRRDASRAARRIAGAGELEAAGRIFPANPALWLWCAKEAAYKAAGTPSTDFARDMRLQEPTAARTLIMTIETVPVTLTTFTRGELLGVCGRVSNR